MVTTHAQTHARVHTCAPKRTHIYIYIYIYIYMYVMVR